MSALRKLQQGVTKGVKGTTRLADRMKDGTTNIIKDARDGIREGLTDRSDRSGYSNSNRSGSVHFHDGSDGEEDPDLSNRFSMAPGTTLHLDDFHRHGYSVRPSDADGGDTSDDDMYLDEEPASESRKGEIGLNDDDSTGAKVKKKKKIKKIRRADDDSDASDDKSTKSSKSRKIKYKSKSGDDSDGSDAKSAKSSKSAKSAKSKTKKKLKSQKSDASAASSKKKKKKKLVSADSSDDDDGGDVLSPLSKKKDPVLPVRSQSPTRSPKKKAGDSPLSSPAPREHPIKQELMRFSDIWKTQAAEGERESIKVSKVAALLGELNGDQNGEGKEADPYENELLDAKLRSTEQKLLDSEAKVEELIVKKSEIQKELDEEQLRNDELGRRLLLLEDRIEELEAEKQELEAQPKVVEQKADPIEVFELQQEVNQLKTEMSITMDRHAEALHSKDERIRELEEMLEAAEAGESQRRESVASIHSASGDARTQGLLLRANDKVQKQEAEIRELKQKLEELGNAEIIEQKDEEIKNLGVQMAELETKMKQMAEKHEKALKEKQETIDFFQNQVVEMQKKMPKPAAYTREKVGEEGTMTLGGEGSDDEGGGLWGAIASASPGWLGGRQAVDRRKAKEAPNAPNL